MEYIQDTLFGRMFAEHSHREKEQTSEPSLQSLLESRTRQPLCLLFLPPDGHMRTHGEAKVGPWRGEFLTHNTGESPNVAVVSTLSQILEADVPKRYFLSPAACEGILRRAERRGKQLPEMLRIALEQMIERERR